MNNLIEKLEAATEGSRELDRKVAATIFTATLEPEDAKRRNWRDLTWVDSLAHEKGYCLDNLLAFTTSLDAALTLVPAGSHVSAQFDTLEEGSDTAASIVLSYGEKRLGGGGASTPALAVCVAVLRTKTAEEK